MTDDEMLMRLYDAAEDWEAEVIDAVRERAGLTWTHQCSETMRWTNVETDLVCGNCGEAKP